MGELRSATVLFTDLVGSTALATSMTPEQIAATRAAWAELLADRGRADDHERAMAMAEEALTMATAGGYGESERRARAVLDRLAPART